MTIQLNIPDQELENFFVYYSSLTSLQKRIWDYLQFFARRYPYCFPSQERIAKFVGCTRQYVNKTIKGFADLGFLSKERRAYRTSEYFFAKFLEIFNVRKVIKSFFKNRFFSNEKLTIQLTQQLTVVSSSSSPKIYKPSKDEAEIHISEKKEEKRSYEIPFFIKSLEIEDIIKKKLCIFPENIVNQAIESLKHRESYDSLDERGDYLFVTCMRIMNERNLKPKWKIFYKLKEKI